MNIVVWEIIGEQEDVKYLIGEIRSLARESNAETIDLASKYCYRMGYKFVKIRKKDVEENS